MVAQTSYTKEIVSRYPGLLFDIGNTNIDSFTAEGAVLHGSFVSRGTLPESQCVVNGSANAIGVAVRHASENAYKQANVGVGSYDDKETVAVMREGYIWCEFDAIGGTIDAAVTITPNGRVKTDGTGVALVSVAAYVEKIADPIVLEGSAGTIFVGLVRVSAK